jgi:hypothetical protein
MPLSGSVTAGSAALASQYNNLRSDVLSTTQGHTHTGASEDGKKVHGTALDSTGASSGQVLTANGAGAVTFAAITGAGQFSLISGTAAYGTVTDGGTAFQYTSGPSGAFSQITTGGGTVIIQALTANSTGGQTFYRRAIDTNSVVASTALAPATAGTVSQRAGGYGFSAGTAFVVLESGHTGSPGVHTVTLRKINVAMSSVMWSTQLFTGATLAGFTGSQSSTGPLVASQGQLRYASGPGIWYGGDYRSYLHGAGTPQIASVWVVNDVSGSAYSAPFGSAAGTAGEWNSARVRGCVFVPSSTAATDGTIYAWGPVGGTPRFVTYTVGSASISAVSTAIGSWSTANADDNWQEEIGVYPGALSAVSYPGNGIWMPSVSKILVSDQFGFSIIDRTFGTVESFAVGGNNDYFDTNYRNVDYGMWDQTTGWFTDGRDVWRTASFNGNIAPYGSATYMDTFVQSSCATLAGNGSATHYFGGWGSTGGTSFSIQLGGVARVPFGGTSATPRIMSITNFDPQRILCIEDSGNGAAFVFNQGGNDAYSYSQPTSFVAGTGQVYVHVTPWKRYQKGSAGTMRARIDATIGGTVVLRGYQVTLGS